MIRRLVFVAIVLLALAGLTGFMLATEPGLRMTFAVAGHLIPGDLAADALRGRLIGPLEVKGLRYRRGESAAAIADLILDWRPARLLTGRLHIDRLRISDIHVRLPAQDVQMERRQPPDLRFLAALTVQDAMLDTIVIERADGSPPLVIDRIALNSRLDAGTLHIDTLQVLGPTLQAQARGTFGTAAPHPLQIDTRWSVAIPDYGPVQGSGRFGGTLERMTFSQALTTPVAASADGTLYDPLHGLRWEARLTLPTTELQALRAEWPAVPVSTSIEGRGDLRQLDVSGTANLTHPAAGELRTDFRLTRRDERWSLENLALQHPASGARVTVQGAWTLHADGPELALRGHWQDLGWPLAPDPAFRTPSGTFTLQGTIDDYALEASGAVSGLPVPTGDWSLAAAGDRTGLAITALRLALLDGALEGSGTVRWSPAPSWTLSIQGQDLNPGSAWPAWPGSIALAARTAGTVQEGQLTATAAIERATGTLRDQPFDLLSQLEISGGRYHLPRLELRSGSARLHASGTVTDVWNLAWELTAPDLQALAPATRGAFEGSGKITGPRPTPRATGTVNGRNIALHDYRLAHLQGRIAIGPQPNEPSSLELDLQGLSLGARSLERVQLRGHGLPDKHELTLSAHGAGANFTARITGAFAANLWRGRLLQADLATAQFGDWTLRDAATFQLGGDQATLEQACWTHQSAAVCAEAAWQPQPGLRADMTLARLPLALAQPLLPPETSLTGTLDGAARATYHAGALHFQVDLTPDDGVLHYIAMDERTRVSFHDARFHAAADAKGLRAQFAAGIDQIGNLDSTLTLPRFNSGVPLPQQPMAGRLRLTLRDLGMIPAFFPATEDTAGTLHVDLNLDGLVAAPAITGQAVLKDGAAELPRLGVHLQDIALELRSDGDEALQFTGSMRSGAGSVIMAGRALLDAARGWPIEATLRGERFQAVNTSEANILVSPDLKLRTQGTHAFVEGTVHIPEATLDRPDRRKTVQVSPDVVIIDGTGLGEAAGPAPSRWTIGSRIRITLGDKVSFTGSGVTGRVGGELTVTEEPGKAPTGTGELRLMDGKYEAYGQELEIERARLIFAASPIDNPALDVLATRKAPAMAETEDGVVAGIQVRGRVKNPEITLVSQPPMPESDILAYLLLGQPLNQASVTEGKILTDAAGSLGLKGGALLAKRIGATFGIEDVYVEQGATPEEASVVLGTYLSPRLYVGYGVGLAESVNSLRIRYQLSRRWILQTRTGVQSGADLLYSIER